ncbi:unnamed protein product [Allacma fusca]|uniref:Uncharacterized protein n=1 Tax=Allacma fusca TaxID=39272 RepID=A0A8J2P7W4_9HEXA|nr:unnamed protein product [Allacma fusca]
MWSELKQTETTFAFQASTGDKDVSRVTGPGREIPGHTKVVSTSKKKRPRALAQSLRHELLKHNPREFIHHLGQDGT